MHRSEGVVPLALPPKLQFFLELNINKKNDDEIFEFLDSQPSAFQNRDDRELLFNYFSLHENYGALFKLIQRMDDDEQSKALCDFKSFAMLSEPQKEELKVIAQRLIDKETFGWLVLKTYVLPKLTAQQLPAPPSPAEKIPTYISKLIESVHRKDAASASALLPERPALQNDEWISILNATTDQGLWGLVPQILDAIPKAQRSDVLTIFFNQVAYGLCSLPDIEHTEANELYAALKLH